MRERMEYPVKGTAGRDRRRGKPARALTPAAFARFAEEATR